MDKSGGEGQGAGWVGRVPLRNLQNRRVSWGKCFHHPSKCLLTVYSHSSRALHRSPAQWELWPEPPTVFQGGQVGLGAEGRWRRVGKLRRLPGVQRHVGQFLMHTIHREEPGDLQSRWRTRANIPTLLFRLQIRMLMHLSPVCCTSPFCLSPLWMTEGKLWASLRVTRASGQNYLQVLVAYLLSAISIIDLNIRGWERLHPN